MKGDQENHNNNSDVWIQIVRTVCYDVNAEVAEISLLFLRFVFVVV